MCAVISCWAFTLMRKEIKQHGLEWRIAVKCAPEKVADTLNILGVM